MADVFPFQAVRYEPTRLNRDLSAVIAPPYDVLDENDRRELLATGDQNIVAVDLPFIPPKSAGPAELYQRSAYLLEAWLREKVLIRDGVPAIYAYHQRFQHESRDYTRRMFVANVQLSPFSEGKVLPHEQTFGGPKEDRLALMRATRCQLSPILGMYTDPDNVVGKALDPLTADEPDVTGKLEGVENRMWVVTETDAIRTVTEALRGRPIYIADGHHRYGTALNYRDELAEQSGGTLSSEHPANFVMFVLCSMDDPGCLILPYHRVLGQIETDEILSAWAPGVQQADDGPADVRLWDGKSHREVPLRFTRREILKELAPGHPAAWYDLDYAYLHVYLIDELLGKSLGQSTKIHYAKSANQARQTAKDESGVALLMNATKMAHLRAVSEAGGLMPQKSTYFHPKLATGMTLYMLH